MGMPMAPPYSMEAEVSVLGGLLLNNELLLEVAEKVSPDDFYRHEHRVAFRAIAEMINARKACDYLTLTEYLQNQGALEEAGGKGHIVSLAVDTYSIHNVLAYAGIVRERSIMRQLIGVGAEIGDLGYRPEGREAEALLERAEGLVLAIRQKTARRTGSESYAVHVAGAEADIEAAFKKGGAMGGMSTGYAKLDAMLDGLHGGDLVIIAGRPGMGKTSLGMNMVEHCALKLQKRAAVMSMEMKGKLVALRSIAGQARVSLQHLRSGRLEDGEWARVAAAGALLRTDRIVLDESSTLSPMEVRAKARRIAARGGLSLLMVDYLQLMAVPGTDENRTNEVTEISRAMKALAMELDIPVIVLSQLNRALESRPDKRPKLSDLRDSGGIEQDADAVLFVYRDEVYHEQSLDKGTAEIIIGKQRSGPTGTVRLAYRNAVCRFEDLGEDEENELREAHRSARKEQGRRGLAKVLG